MSFHTDCAITDITCVGDARRTAARLVESNGMSDAQSGAVAIVVTELATNIVRHARSGQLWMRASKDMGFEVLACDRGPGMNVLRCMQDGYSTGGTAGNGLGAVRRSSTEFDGYASEHGSVVFSRISNQLRKPDNKPQFQWGVVALCAPGETVCGDAWALDIQNDELHVMVADGLGHGPEAFKAASTAASLFYAGETLSPKSFVEQAHRALSGTRGAALAVGHTSALRRGLSYAGVGNITGTLISHAASRGLMSHNGTVGAQMRTVQQIDYDWPDGWLLVLHSDGLLTRWDVSAYPGIFSAHPAVFCGVLIRDFVRGRDDVTVVVIRRI